MKDQKIILLIVAIVVGGVIGAIVVNNQMTLNREIRLRAQEQKEKSKEEEQNKKQDDVAKADRSMRLRACVNQADTDYWKYVELNATRTKVNADSTKTYYAEQVVWDKAEASRKSAKDECYRLDSTNSLPIPTVEQLNSL